VLQEILVHMNHSLTLSMVDYGVTVQSATKNDASKLFSLRQLFALIMIPHPESWISMAEAENDQSRGALL